MKKVFVISIFILFITSLSCKSEHTDSTANIPSEVSTLHPINVIDLSSFLSEPSGIVFNSKDSTLLIVSDAEPEIYVTDLDGKLLNTISISGDDLEGITLAKNADTIYVVEESSKLVSSFFYDGEKISSMLVDVATDANNALEGITIDKNGELFVINEKSPRLMLEFFNGVEQSRKEITYTSDLSDICYDVKEDCFWIISDESKEIFKIDREGTLLGQWLITFEKGEGITFVGDKIYVVCDADSKMYIYNQP